MLVEAFVAVAALDTVSPFLYTLQLVFSSINLIDYHGSPEIILTIFL